MPTLDWLNRDDAFRIAERVPTRVLRPHSAGHEFGDVAHSGNLLIQGDNLEALKALLPLYRGRVKCIFIDPPYNTQSAFEHYDDKLEHSQWLTMMLPRLQLLRESRNGSAHWPLKATPWCGAGCATSTPTRSAASGCRRRSAASTLTSFAS